MGCKNELAINHRKFLRGGIFRNHTSRTDASGKGGKRMKNTLADLNNHLFMQLERLNDEDLKGEALQEEINRAKAITQVATQIINNGALVLDALKWRDDMWDANTKMPVMLEGVVEKAPKEKRKMPQEIRSQFLGG